MPPVEVEPIVNVSEAARANVLEIRATEQDPEKLALWVEVSGVSGASYTYDMWFQAADEAGEDEVIQRQDDLPLVLAQSSVDKRRGATLDPPTHRAPVTVNPPSP